MSAPEPGFARLLRRLDRRVSALGLLLAGGAILGALWCVESWLAARGELAAAEVAAAAVAREDLDAELHEREALRELVAGDLRRAKAQAASLSRSRRALFEGGLALSEEKRVLEKQWEIMTTWLEVDPQAGQLRVMRGEQAYESVPLGGAVPRAAGGETRALPKLATVVSKERFAAPERGRAVQEGGRLEWEPPQVGASQRAGALGEHVLFTKEGLVIHGPPLRPAEHESYPHLCLSLPAASAAKVYSRAFIGTKAALR